jgi:hypothetical protein
LDSSSPSGLVPGIYGLCQPLMSDKPGTGGTELAQVRCLCRSGFLERR